MLQKGRITVRGIVQGVGFRPFVFAQAQASGISGTVKNLGSEVEIYAKGSRFEEFLAAVSRAPRSPGSIPLRLRTLPGRSRTASIS